MGGEAERLATPPRAAEASPTARRGRWSNLGIRAATAMVLAPSVILLVWLGDGWMRGLVVLVASVCLAELYGSMRRAGLTPAWLPGAGGGLALVLAPDLVPVPWILAGLVLGCALWMAAVRHERWTSFFGSVGGALYIAAPLALGVPLRDRADGLDWAILLLTSVWVCDSGAYLVGSRFGRHKLWPEISPKKSWEGLAGGLAAASLAALLLSLWLHVNPLAAPFAGLAVALATSAGDLVESAIKRGLGVKDMGSLLPGHGGLLDRIDGLLAAIPVGYLCAVYFGG